MGVEQNGSKTEVAFHELLWILRMVNTSEIEHEVAIHTPCIQFLGSRVYVIFIHLIYYQVTIALSLTFLNVKELNTGVLTYEPLRSCY